MPSLLIVDSFTDEAQMYAEYFRTSGFLVDVCSDPRDAVARARALTPDVVITRLRHPSAMTGIDVVRALRHDHATRAVPVAILTTSIDPADRAAADREGCDAYFRLPTLPDELADEIWLLILRSTRERLRRTR